MTITKKQIIDAIRDELNETGVFNRVQGSSNLTEGMNDTPTLQVYWESTDNDAATQNDRTTFRGGVRQKHFIFHCDIYARQRSHLDEDTEAVLDLSDAVEAKLERRTARRSSNSRASRRSSGAASG